MYKLALALCLLLAAGCSPATPDLRPFVAVAVRYSIQASPAPEVTPGGKCKTCRGAGKVGDGRVFVTCAACNGTGVEPKPGAPAAAVAPATPNQCKDGTCPTPTTKR
jgi:hypothetical protein